MPSTKRSISDIARDLVDATEVSAAFRASATLAPKLDKGREVWVQRWLGLSEWARARELRELEAELTEALQELQHSSDLVQQAATELMYRRCHAETSLRDRIESQAPAGTSDIARCFAETKTAWDNEMQAAGVAATKRHEYAEAQAAVTAARLRCEAAHRHCAEIRRVRIRTMVTTFLITIVVMVIAAAWFYFSAANTR